MRTAFSGLFNGLLILQNGSSTHLKPETTISSHTRPCVYGEPTMHLVLLVWCCITAMLSLASNHSCSTWLFYSNSSDQCECSDNSYYSGYVYCNQESMTVQVKNGFCVTYSGREDLFYGGVSPLWYKVNNTDRLYILRAAFRSGTVGGGNVWYLQQKGFPVW